MGYSDSPRSIGSPSLGLGHEIIATILDLLATSWESVSASGELAPTSLEPKIAGLLGREMIAEKQRRRIRNLRFEEETGTRRSLDAPKVEGRIDIKVIYSFDEAEYFGIECKRISGSKAGDLAREYVTEGVARFVGGKYSPGHAWAAMVGFVVDGTIPKAIQFIVAALTSRRESIQMRDSWNPEERFGKHDYLYRTLHGQSEQDSEIAILHLFLALN